MIVKMIQHLEIKMESQINSLETRVEKMQERLYKDLEEILKSQYIVNNAKMRSKTLWREQIVEKQAGDRGDQEEKRLNQKGREQSSQ